MLARTNRAIALAAATAIALTAASVTPASADRRSNAAGAAAFAAIVGTIATVIIADQQRRDWESRQAYPGSYYGYGQAPYAGGYRGNWHNWRQR